MNHEILAKSLVALCDIPAGTEVKEAMIGIQSPGQGLQPNRLSELIGKRLTINKAKGEFFFASDLERPSANPRPYEFRHNFGLPVRYHDIEKFANKSNLKLVEIHLSYKDLDELSKVLPDKERKPSLVHAPELFAGDLHTRPLLYR